MLTLRISLLFIWKYRHHLRSDTRNLLPNPPAKDQAEASSPITEGRKLQLHKLCNFSHQPSPNKSFFLPSHEATIKCISAFCSSNYCWLSFCQYARNILNCSVCIFVCYLSVYLSIFCVRVCFYVYSHLAATVSFSIFFFTKMPKYHCALSSAISQINKPTTQFHFSGSFQLSSLENHSRKNENISTSIILSKYKPYKLQ